MRHSFTPEITHYICPRAKMYPIDTFAGQRFLYIAQNFEVAERMKLSRLFTPTKDHFFFRAGQAMQYAGYCPAAAASRLDSGTAHYSRDVVKRNVGGRTH